MLKTPEIYINHTEKYFYNRLAPLNNFQIGRIVFRSDYNKIHMFFQERFDTMKKTGGRLAGMIVLLLIGVAFVLVMNYLFDNNGAIHSLFSGRPETSQVIGQVEPGAGIETQAERLDYFARLAMLIFSVIAVLQFFAFCSGVIVLSGIKHGADSAEIKLKQLDNADVFFDVPLYIGLFGTISGFLLLVFSPHNSLLIAYSSTLIGIIISVVLRLALLYPYRKGLLSATGGIKGGAAK